MQEMTTHYNFIQNMFDNISCNDILTYSNIFIGTFCLLQLISFSFQAIDYVFDNKTQKDVTSNDIKSNDITPNDVTPNDVQKTVEKSSDNEDDETAEDEEDDDYDSDTETEDERHKMKTYTWDVQTKITNIIQSNEDLFADKRSASRLKYKINKEINEYFAQAYIEYMQKQQESNESDDEEENSKKKVAT